MVKRCMFEVPFSSNLPPREDWLSKGIDCVPRGDVTCFTDGSLANHRAGAGIHVIIGDEVIDRSFSLGKHVTVFQSEVFAVLQCCYLLMDKQLRGLSVNIFIDSQVCIKALTSVTVRSNLIRQCKEALQRLCEDNMVGLYWVPGHVGIDWQPS